MVNALFRVVLAIVLWVFEWDEQLQDCNTVLDLFLFVFQDHMLLRLLLLLNFLKIIEHWKLFNHEVPQQFRLWIPRPFKEAWDIIIEKIFKKTGLTWPWSQRIWTRLILASRLESWFQCGKYRFELDRKEVIQEVRVDLNINRDVFWFKLWVTNQRKHDFLLKELFNKGFKGFRTDFHLLVIVNPIHSVVHDLHYYISPGFLLFGVGKVNGLKSVRCWLLLFYLLRNFYWLNLFFLNVIKSWRLSFAYHGNIYVYHFVIEAVLKI